VTLPASRQGIIAGVIICGLPMFGDYFTQQLLAATNGTRMVGNFIVESLQIPIFVARGAALILILLALLVVPIVYYLWTTSRALPERRRERPLGAVEPWGRPVPVGRRDRLRVWILIPIVYAVIFSFNETRSISIFTGFSLRWWLSDPDDSLLQDPAIRQAIVQTLKLASLTTLIAVPVGVAFALGLDRWRGRTATTTNFVMMFSFITPELILAVSLFLLFINAFSVIGLGRPRSYWGSRCLRSRTRS
jgi:ABC-type spermidine/putrescine transport system permease subunit II